MSTPHSTVPSSRATPAKRAYFDLSEQDTELVAALTYPPPAPGRLSTRDVPDLTRPSPSSRAIVYAYIDELQQTVGFYGGMAVVPVNSQEGLRAAVYYLGRRRKTSYEKATLIFAQSTGFSPSPTWNTRLADAGIIHLTSTHEDLDTGARLYLENFERRLKAARENLHAYMNKP